MTIKKKKKAEDLIQRNNYSCTLVDIKLKYMGGRELHPIIYQISLSLKNDEMLGSMQGLLQRLLSRG